MQMPGRYVHDRSTHNGIVNWLNMDTDEDSEFGEPNQEVDVIDLTQD